ncbi:uncharacterized protein LOC118205126, partial [Stegodyphus dumicola]|uniref:uncharacterized protein LOC118205126 n=1 Tax=Stegodyphus dumicola TaxID=202533 RepID=UPI0015B0BF36
MPNLRLYTDGSQHDDHTGCALVAYYDNEEIFQWLCKFRTHNSVFQAEAEVLLQAVKFIKTSGEPESIIITDSLSSLSAIQNFRHTPTITQIQQELLSATPLKITLAWTKGHAADVGNIAADKLAKEAAIGITTGNYTNGNLNGTVLTLVIGHTALLYVDVKRHITNPQVVRYASGHGPFPSYFNRFGTTNTD